MTDTSPESETETEGLRFLWRQPILRTLAVFTGVFNLATNATWAILVLYAVGPRGAMGLSDSGCGLLLAAAAAGSLLGSFLGEAVERKLGRARSLVLTILGGALLVGTPALTANPFVIGAAFVVGGTTIVIGNVITVSLRQRITPARLLGSVNSGSASLVGAPCRSGPPLGVYSHSFSDSGPCSPSWRC